MDMREIQDKLLEAFQKSGYSYGDLARITGLPKSALQRYIAGSTEKIPIDRLRAICKVLDLDTAVLLGWKAEEQVDPVMRLREKIRKNPEYGILFGAAADVSEEDISKAVRILQAFKEDAGE